MLKAIIRWSIGIPLLVVGLLTLLLGALTYTSDPSGGTVILIGGGISATLGLFVSMKTRPDRSNRSRRPSLTQNDFRAIDQTIADLSGGIGIEMRMGRDRDDRVYRTNSYDALQTIEARVAGVTHKNPDGKSRQEIIGRCQVGELVGLRREPQNPVDPNAIRVERLNGEQIGYLGKDLAAKVSAGIRDGQTIYARIQILMGYDKENLGVGLEIWSVGTGEEAERMAARASLTR